MSKSQAAVFLPAAVLEIFPNVQLIDGGPTFWGFYYDFQFPFHFQSHFLTLIEDQMHKMVKTDSVQIVD